MVQGTLGDSDDRLPPQPIDAECVGSPMDRHDHD